MTPGLVWVSASHGRDCLLKTMISIQLVVGAGPARGPPGADDAALVGPAETSSLVRWFHSITVLMKNKSFCWSALLLGTLKPLVYCCLPGIDVTDLTVALL